MEASIGPDDPLDANAFGALVRNSDDLAPIVEALVLDGVPYVFESRPQDWQDLRSALTRTLGTRSEDIFIVGSAKMGFSLAPRKFGRPFSEGSDIDVAIIDSELFDTLWLSVVRWHYRRRHRLPPADRKWDDDRRQELYWGYVNPTSFQYKGLTSPGPLRPAKRVSTRWFNAFQELGRIPPISGRRITGRLYRSREHAVAYQDQCLRKIRIELRRSQP